MTYIIADIGSNHDGSKIKAMQLICCAAKCGVNAAKFQLFKADTLYPSSAEKRKLVKPHELPEKWLPDLKKTCEKMGLDFICSPFDIEAVESLENIGVSKYKIASSEIVKHGLIKAVTGTGKPIIMSTGMSDLVDVYDAVASIKSTGFQSLTLLQCTSLYPTEPHQVNLRVMDSLKQFDCPVGLSDHTLGIEVSLAAVARGAMVIEKHLTFSRKLKGPDHPYAMEPAEFKALVEGIKKVEACLGSPLKTMLPEEKKWARGIRHGLK